MLGSERSLAHRERLLGHAGGVVGEPPQPSNLGEIPKRERDLTKLGAENSIDDDALSDRRLGL